MAEAQTRTMPVEEFYLWQLDQDERYELVEGVPAPLRAMTGASNVHDVIWVNCIGELHGRLRVRREIGAFPDMNDCASRIRTPLPHMLLKGTSHDWPNLAPRLYAWRIDARR